MNRPISTYTTWGLLLLAILAWMGLGLFTWTIMGEEGDRAASIESAAQSSTKNATAVRLHGLVEDTAASRAQLAGLFNVDVISVADMIDAAGKSAGASVKLGDALPENPPPQIPGAPPIKAVGFVVEATGKFSTLMRLAELVETLPIPASLEELDIQHIQSTGAADPGSWHMSASIRVLTTSAISP